MLGLLAAAVAGGTQASAKAADKPKRGEVPPGTPDSALPSAWAAMTGAAPEALGISVRPVDGGASLMDSFSRVPLNPASTMKVITTYAALGLLGPTTDGRRPCIWMDRFAPGCCTATSC
jgi:D-alanyl-D-alanine carboxypeptidase